VICVNQRNPNDSNRNIPNNLQQIKHMSSRSHTLNHALTQHGKKEKIRMAVTIIAFPQMQMNGCKSPFTMCYNLMGSLQCVRITGYVCSTKNSMLDEGNTIWVGHKRGPNTYDPYPQATIGLPNKVSASSNKVPQVMLKGKGSLWFCQLSAWRIVPSISCAPLSASHAIVLGT